MKEIHFQQNIIKGHIKSTILSLAQAKIESRETKKRKTQQGSSILEEKRRKICHPGVMRGPFVTLDEYNLPSCHLSEYSKMLLEQWRTRHLPACGESNKTGLHNILAIITDFFDTLDEILVDINASWVVVGDSIPTKLKTDARHSP